MLETKDCPSRMSAGGCSSVSTPATPNPGSTKETAGSVQGPGLGGAFTKNWVTGCIVLGMSGGRKIAVVGRSEKKLIQDTPRRSSRSMIVPLIGLYPPGGGKISAVVRCPKEVAASAYERFGKVGPITEEKYRSL